MSTLAVRAPAAKLWTPLRGFAHAVAAAVMVIEVFDEAQHQVYEAKQRYPFRLVTACVRMSRASLEPSSGRSMRRLTFQPSAVRTRSQRLQAAR